jgi:hypothetical protein
MTLSSIELAARGAGAIFLKFDGPLMIPFEHTSSGLVVIMYQDVMLCRHGPKGGVCTGAKYSYHVTMHLEHNSRQYTRDTTQVKKILG